MSDVENKPQEATEATTANTEPAEPSTESVADAVKVPVSSLGATVFTILAFCMLVLFVVATPINWFENQTSATKFDYTLFTQTATKSGVTTVTYVSQITCDELRKRYRAIEAFAVISILLAAAGVFVGINAIVNKASMVVPTILGAVTLFTSMTAWGMGVRLFYQDQICGMESLSQAKMEFGPGVALFITGWAVSILATIVAAKNPTLPPVLPDALVDAVGGYIYTIFAFAAFVFLVCGTPVQIIHLWASEDVYIQATMWKIKVKTISTAVTTSYDFNQLGTVLGDTCVEIDRFAKFAQSFAIIAIAFGLFAFVSGILFVARKFGKGIPMILGALAALFALLSAAACAVMYYRRFCVNTPSLAFLGFRLDAGVALFVAAVILLAVGSIILAIIALVQHISSGAKGGNVNKCAFVFLFGSVVSLFFLILGASQPIIVNVTDDFNYVKFSFWKSYILSSNVFSIQNIGCSDMSTRLNGGGVLCIIAIFFSLLAIILGIAQLINANLRKAASFALLFGSLPQLVSWGLAVSVFTTTFCGNDYYVNGYSIGVGLGLIIASWCLSVFVSVRNLMVAPE